MALGIHLNNCPNNYKKLIKRRIYESYNFAAWGYLQANHQADVREMCCLSLAYEPRQPKLYLYWMASFLPTRIISALKEIRRQLCQN